MKDHHPQADNLAQDQDEDQEDQLRNKQPEIEPAVQDGPIKLILCRGSSGLPAMATEQTVVAMLRHSQSWHAMQVLVYSPHKEQVEQVR